MKKKILVPVLCILMMLIGGFATWAYLTSQAEVVNTFTAGNVEITMDETDVDINGEKDGETRVIKNNYHLLPGHGYIKDPIIHVTELSDDCWLFVSVKNEITDIECNNPGYVNIESQMAANGWVKMNGIMKDGGQVYYHAVVAKNASDKDIKVFQNFKIDGENAVNKSENLAPGTFDIAKYDKKTIVVKAYAVQADGFTTPEAAWDATFVEK